MLEFRSQCQPKTEGFPYHKPCERGASEASFFRVAWDVDSLSLIGMEEMTEFQGKASEVKVRERGKHWNGKLYL